MWALEAFWENPLLPFSVDNKVRKAIFSNFLLILTSRSAQRLLPSPSSFPFSRRVVKACSKMATKSEK